MKIKFCFGALALSAPFFLPLGSSCAQTKAPVKTSQTPVRQTEKLGRGLVVLPQEDGKNFLSWRLLGGDAENLAFNLYRVVGNEKAVKLNAIPLSKATSFRDESAPKAACKYLLRSINGNRESGDLASANVEARGDKGVLPYRSVPLQIPAAPEGSTGYVPNDASIGDLDGDGEMDIVLHWAGRAKDNSQGGVTDAPILQGLKLDGTLLWTIDLGRNIRDGAHYTQFLVFDFDGDGRSEVVCKTADGTRDGTNGVLGDAKANWVDEGGRILRGPEFLSVFDGKSGKFLATSDYIPARHPTKRDPSGDELKAVWGDNYGNRGDRFLACVAYLDGVHPSIVMARGYYTRTVLAAWDFRGGKLQHRWTFDSNDAGNDRYAGQGNHNLSVADVDGDGRDEIVYGKMCVDDNGKGLYSTGIGHGDAMHLSDLDPTRPGLEVFSIQEPFADAGAHIFDARSGEIVWKKASTNSNPNRKVEGPGRGLALDIDPRTAGAECWAAGAGLSGQLWDAKGNKIADRTPSVNMGVWWDGDFLRELLDGTSIRKWNWEQAREDVILEGAKFGVASNNGTKATPCLVADLWGDWREEVIWRSADNRELRIFTSAIATEHRLPTLLHDATYRLGVAWQNVGYNQPPHTGFFLGDGMKTPVGTK